MAYSSPMDRLNIENLSPEQRLQLIEQLWESLSQTPHSIPLPPAQRHELDRRLDEIEREGAEGIPWDEVLRRIRQRAD